MALDADEERVIRHLHRLHQLVGGTGRGDETGGHIPDCLVMHAVDGQCLRFRDPGQTAVGLQGHGVGGERVGEGLGVGQREITLYLAGNILPDGAAQADV